MAVAEFTPDDGTYIIYDETDADAWIQGDPRELDECR